MTNRETERTDEINQQRFTPAPGSFPCQEQGEVEQMANQEGPSYITLCQKRPKKEKRKNCNHGVGVEVA